MTGPDRKSEALPETASMRYNPIRIPTPSHPRPDNRTNEERPIMNRRILVASATVLLLVAMFANPAQGETVTLFSDDFSTAISSSVTNTIHNAAYEVGDETTAWSVLEKVYQAGGTVKLASTTADGVMVTTNLSVQAGTVLVQLRGLGWNGDERTFTVGIGSDVRTLVCSDDRTAAPYDFDDFAETFEVAAGVVQVTIRAVKNKRVFVDDVLVTQDQVDDPPEPAFAIDFATPSTVEETFPVSFSIGAQVRGNPTNVTRVTALPVGGVYVVTNLVGYFSWTPALGQAGVYPLVFTASGADGGTYTTTVTITVTELQLTPPQNLTVSNLTYNAFDLSWVAVPAATQGYLVSVWTGSSATNTPNADLETFWETTDNHPVQPLGWSFAGITLEYMDKGLNEVSFDTTGDAIVTRLYPKAVTELSFRLQGRSTANTSNSVLAVLGTADGTTWTSLQSYSTLSDSDGDDENNIFTTADDDLEKSLAIDGASGCRQFKFVYTKDKGNVGIGNISAVYEGAGTKFVEGWNRTAMAGTIIDVNGLRPGRTYYALVGARNATETMYSQLGLTTLDSPRGTLFVVR